MSAFLRHCRGAAGSAARAFAAAALAAFLQLGKQPLDLRAEDLPVLVNAGLAALLVVAVNGLRQGETRYGPGADLGPATDPTDPS